MIDANITLSRGDPLSAVHEEENETDSFLLVSSSGDDEQMQDLVEEDHPTPVSSIASQSATPPRLSSTEEYDNQQQNNNLWEFAPHTVHNSLALDAALAEDVTEALRQWKLDKSNIQKQEDAKHNLQQLRNQVCDVLSKDAMGWTRTRKMANGAIVSRRSREPRGNFYTIRTEGTVQSATPSSFIRQFLGGDQRRNWEPSFANYTVIDDDLAPDTLPLAKPWYKHTEYERQVVPKDWNEFLQQQKISTEESLLLANAPLKLDQNIEKMAVFCQICACALSDTVKHCPACARLACQSCLGRRAYSIQNKISARICRECYVDHPDVYHPDVANKNKGYWNMADIKLRQEERQQGLSAAEAQELLENRESAAPTVIDDDENDSRDMVQEEAFEEEIPLEAKNGRTIYKKQNTEIKWSKCTRCGARVARTVEAIEAHACPEEEGRRWRWPRIIYRTAKMPRSSLFRPRQVCSFQDCFHGDDQALYCYEISVRHVNVTGERNHVTVEVLLLAHAARISANGGCELTVVSQVDSGRNSRAPGWMVALVNGEDARFGALAAFESPAAATARELRNSSSDNTSLTEEQQDDTEIQTSAQVSLADFELVAVLGRGGFGTVMQVRKRSNGKVYAMKVFKKAELRRRRQVERTRTERGIIQKLDHPYVVKLRYAFQTEAKLYMVMDFAQGGDFFSFLRRFKRLKEPWARHYLAEIALALHHLHEVNVVYRDLKPENVLMDGDGHALLADFGLSRDFGARSPLPRDTVALLETSASQSRATLGGMLAASRSYCGTEIYMAPEMLLQRGHTRSVDWWGLGLLAHEMLASRHPFHGASHAETLRNMVKREPELDRRLSPLACSLLLGLLAKKPHDRLGTHRGVHDLAAQPFFANYSTDWNSLLHRQVPAPYKPPLANDVDVSQFDDEFTNETPRDSDFDREQALKNKNGGNIQDNHQGGKFFVDLFTLRFPNTKPASPSDNYGRQGNPSPDESNLYEDEFTNFTYIEPSLLESTTTTTTTDNSSIINHPSSGFQ
eukprot:CAMPEP_0197320590 /NCGR_PEP_ID=MMETSP0891-20130614/60865_1 /TAXON_ID=44058 ORGANISM="Aureoumbra lagunensis, Strain CCMP1510" /NCGR_SAMPLE_ID=MMETSP0891 /ASSEMBLY_ACC=CAM_ASM_000534 /LENGTH=1019 /DNA_ID=CAMNT_0042812071 /DNA_START=424 /DNA_END=3483 /DNA_ORIENTATION=-